MPTTRTGDLGIIIPALTQGQLILAGMGCKGVWGRLRRPQTPLLWWLCGLAPDGASPQSHPDLA